MNHKICTPVSVSLSYDSSKQKSFPRWVIWNGKMYPVTKIGLHHTYREGRTLFHVFSVAANTLFLRLVLDTETLHWQLEEISDGLPD